MRSELMEIEDLSKSFLDDACRYVATRLITVAMVSLWLLLLAAAWLLHGPADGVHALGQAVWAALLIVQFRLWDDLADVDHDRETNSSRVLCVTKNLAAFRTVCAGLMTITFSLLLVLEAYDNLVLFCVLTLLIAALYRWPTRDRWPLIRYHVLLLKYPAFVLMIESRDSLAPASARAVTGLLVYLGLCVYEVGHDSSLRSNRRFRAVAAIESVAILVMLATTIGKTF